MLLFLKVRSGIFVIEYSDEKYLDRGGDGIPNDAGFGLPRPQTDGRNLGSGIQLKEANRFRHFFRENEGKAATVEWKATS